MKLAKREKIFLSAAGFVLGIFLIIEQLVLPFFDEKAHLENETKKLEKYIEDMNGLGSMGHDIDEISGSLELAISNRGGESLFAFVNKEAETIGLKNNMTRVNPSEGKKQGGFIEDIIEIQLDAITQRQLTEYLYRIEKPERYIFINKITIKHNKKEETYLDTTIRLLTYKIDKSAG